MGFPASKQDRSGEASSFAALRAEMVERNIAARGVRDGLVLDAMRKVPRELFLPENLREFAYEDSPLPIAGEQTISQPYIVAFMAEALMLRGGDKVLEIGAGSGYAAAVLSEIAAHVYTVERLGPLAEQAAERLADLGYDNVHVLHGDGTKGWPEHAPYDAIVVAAGGPQVPEFAEGAAQDRRPAGDPGRRGSAGPGTGAGHAHIEERIPQRGYRRRPLRAPDRRGGMGDERARAARNRAGCCGRLHPPRKRWSATSPMPPNPSPRSRPPISIR